MPSQQHEQWKQDLFDHLDRKLSGCISCEFEEARDSHAPTHRGRHREPSQQVLWTCERMHPHSYDLLRGAGFVVMVTGTVRPNRRPMPPGPHHLGHPSRAPGIHRDRAIQPSQQLPPRGGRAGNPAVHHSRSSQAVPCSRAQTVPALVGLRPQPAGGRQAPDVLHGAGGRRADAP